MSDAYLGEIRLFPFNWAPDGWLPCDGRQLNITQYAALWSLLGKQFGGDGQTTFNLPDMRGRVAVSQGPNTQTSPSVTYAVGNTGGQETVALTAAQVPQHTHDLNAANVNGTVGTANNNYFAVAPALHNLYAAPTSVNANAITHFVGDTVSTTGGGAPHNNLQPSLVLNFCICTAGNYPPRP